MTDTTSSLNDLPPKHLLTRFSVGDCEMRPNPSGQWVNAQSLQKVLYWLMDDDDKDAMLSKLKRLRSDLL